MDSITHSAILKIKFISRFGDRGEIFLELKCIFCNGSVHTKPKSILEEITFKMISNSEQELVETKNKKFND